MAHLYDPTPDEFGEPYGKREWCTPIPRRPIFLKLALIDFERAKAIENMVNPYIQNEQSKHKTKPINTF